MGIDYSITKKNPDLAASGKAAMALADALLEKAALFDNPEVWCKQIRAEQEVIAAHISSVQKRVLEDLSRPQLHSINALGVQLYEQVVWLQAKMYLTYFNEHGVTWEAHEQARVARRARSA